MAGLKKCPCLSTHSALAGKGWNAMHISALKIKGIRARAVVLKLKRPVVARIATITDWPLILIDLYTDEGVVGRSYLEPYTVKTMRYLIPALQDLGELIKGRHLAPAELFDLARKSLHFVGYQGMSMIAVSGLDMAAWDALAKAAGVPLCVLLGGSVGPVNAYNSNGLWLREPKAVAAEAIELRDEGGFRGLKLRLGRDRIRDDEAALDAVRNAVGEDVRLMVDFNQGLHFGEALQRCHAIDDFGLAWIEEPIVYDNLDGYVRLARELKTPIQIGENFYGPRDLHTALQRNACDYVMPDFMRIGGVTGWLRAAAIAGAAGIPMSTHLYPEVAAHVMRVTETAHWLEWQDWADPILQRPYKIEDGLLHIPDALGVGLDWNEAAVAANQFEL
jgi:mandelate racemase